MRDMGKLFRFSFLIFLICGQLHGQEISIDKLSENESDLNFIYDLKVDQNGRLHIASDRGLFLYDGFGFNQLKLTHSQKSPFISTIEKGDSTQIYGHFQGELSSTIGALDLKPMGKVIAIVGGLHHKYIFNQQGQFFELDHNYQLINEVTIDDNLLAYEVQYKNGLIYIATSKGLFVYSAKKQSLELKKHLFQGENIKAVFAENRIFVATDKKVKHISLIVGELVEIDLSPLLKGDIKSILADDNRLIVGTSRGLYDLYIAGPNYFVSAKKEFDGEKEFSISKLIFGPDKSIYAGTNGNGLWGIYSTPYYFLPNQSIDNKAINCIERFSKDIFIFGGNNGVSFYSNGKLINNEFEEVRQLENMNITSFEKSKLGIYIGTEESGIWLLKPDKSLKQLIPEIISVRDIEADSIGNLWISTSFEGLFAFSNNRLVDFSERNLFNRSDLSKILLRGDNLWFINGDEGLAYIDIRDSSYNLPKNVPSVKLLDFDINRKGEIFGATENDGIMYALNDKISFIDIKKVTNSSQCFSIFANENGSVLFTNQNALFMWSPEYGVRASLMTEYFPSTFRQLSKYGIKPTNWVYYGTEKGVLYFHSNQEQKLNSSKFFFTLNNIDYKEVSEVNLNYSPYLKLQFRFEDMVSNSRLKYYFQINEVDTVWRKTDGNIIEYSNLGYGKFTIRINAFSDDGVLFRTQVIRLSIKKPFWLQLWFYIIVFLILSIALYLIVQYRIKQLKIRNLQLTEIVNLRTREITLKNKRLEQFAYAVSHDLKNPVINIIGLIDILNQKNAIKDRESKRIFDMLTHSSSQLDRLVKGLVELLKIRNDSVEISKVQISQVLEEVKSTISLQILESKAAFNEDIQVDTILYNHTYLYSIVYNLISNAVKYRDTYRDLVINFSTKREGDYVVLVVEDTGLGMDLEENKDRLFKMFQRFHDHVEGTGVGLHLIKEMVENSGGYIDVESQLRVGTKFIVYLKES
jgi:signal transduction histidine kinase/ligand-binding sensor domain-containing protein